MGLRLRAAIFAVFAACFMTALVVSAPAEQYEYKEYTVQKGDTLWDISNRELKDPFSWPLVWKENGLDIENPDLIFPGQVIRIPLSLLRQPETVPEVKEPVAAAEEPAPEEPAAPVAVEIRKDAVMITADEILMGGYITKTPPGAGVVSGSPRQRMVFGGGDEVYIDVAGGASVGDKFYAVRKAARVYDPATGEYLGHMIDILGIIEVERVGERDITARVIKGYAEIVVGDLLDGYYEVEPVIVTGKPREPEVRGQVVASANMRTLSGLLNFVHINRGTNDGLRAGDEIVSLSPGTPDRPNGVLRVINPRQRTSSAIILRNVLDVSIGDDVVGFNVVR